jgi:hypothetical protein
VPYHGCSSALARLSKKFLAGEIITAKVGRLLRNLPGGGQIYELRSGMISL